MLLPSFLSSISESSINLCNQEIERARFGNHIQLNQLSVTIDKAFRSGYAQGASQLIDRYFSIAGFVSEELDGEELLIAYGQLERFNRLKWLLPMQTWEGQESEQKPYDYDGRYIAWIIHKIAIAYGWTRHYIFDLWPEEVFFYLQEIVIDEYNESDERRSLSEVAYSYDKVTKKSKFIPLPRPDWMVSKPKETETHKIPIKNLPMGHVVKLEDIIH